MGDINGDGFTDIATPNINSDNVSVLLGNGQGSFAPQRTFNVGDAPRSLVMGDINGDGFINIATANLDSDNVSLLSFRRFVDTATRLVQSNVSPCETTSLPLREDNSFFTNLPNCTIERLELDLNLPANSRGQVSLRSPSGRDVQFLTLPNSDYSTGLASPESIAPLARFESHPLGGLWTLNTEGFDVDGGQMLINTYPDDPFASDTLAPACNANEDQLTEPDFACRFNGERLEGLTVGGQDDEQDAFLLEGDFDGAFVRGQTILATLTTDPGAEVTLELRAFRASKAVATAQEVEPGVWQLAWTVPSEYSLRYFSLHVLTQSEDVVVYSLEADAFFAQ